jgi:uncharacterized protein with LGFP repeats
MRRTSFTAITGLIMTILGLALTVPAQAKPALAQQTCDFAVGPHFQARYNEHPNEYGCPFNNENSPPGVPGSYQNFVNGQMAWSPPQGANMVVSGFRFTYWDSSGSHIGIRIQYGSSLPYNYDAWLIRVSKDGTYLGQHECTAGGNECGRTDGVYFYYPSGGLIQFMIEGCDVNLGSHTCRQGWTIPIYMWG